MFLSTAFSLRHASWKDKCDVHRNISYGFQLLTLITTGQSCGDRSHRALLLMTHQVLCYTEVSPIRKFVSNDRKFRPLEWSKPKGKTKHCVFEARIGTQVKSEGILWDADDHNTSYFQILSVIVHSYNIQPQFFIIKYYSVGFGLPPQFINLWRGLWLVQRHKQLAWWKEDQFCISSNCGGKQFLQQTLMPKSMGWML